MILIDQLVEYPHEPYGHRYWCHMMSDNLTDAGLEELHAMAHAIGLARARFQNKPRLPHYDLTPTLRQLALEQGAQEVSAKQLVQRCRRVSVVAQRDAGRMDRCSA